MNKTCFMCGESHSNTDTEYYRMREVKSVYRVHGFKDICESCGAKADEFIDYWGEKKREDLDNLMDYFNSGVLSQRKFSALMNAGYY